MIEVYNSKVDNNVTKLTLALNEQKTSIRFTFKTSDDTTTLFLDGYEDVDLSIPSRSYLLCRNSMAIQDSNTGNIDNISSLELTSMRQMFGQNYQTVLTLLVSAALAIVDIDENGVPKIYTSVSVIECDLEEFAIIQSNIAYNRLKGEFGY